MKKIWVLAILTVFAFQAQLNAQLGLNDDDKVWLNPGLKLGYRFGENGGFVIGAELSIVWERNDSFTGLVLAFDYCNNTKTTRYNISAETLPIFNAPIGVAFGPTLIVHDSLVHFGFTGTMYCGILIIPYFSATMMSKNNTDFELGSYAKFPILYKGSKYKLD